MSQRPEVSAVVLVWVEESCAAQGLAVKVTEPEAVGRAATLLGEGCRPHAPGPEALPRDAAAR